MIDDSIKLKLREDYWISKLDTENPSYQSVVALNTEGTGQILKTSDDETIIKLSSKLTGNQEGMFTILISAFSLILHKLFDRDSLVLTTPSFNFENTVPMELDNLILIKSEYDRGFTLKQFSAKLHEEILQSIQHVGVSSEVIQQRCKTDEGNFNPLNFGFRFLKFPDSKEFNEVSLILDILNFDESGLEFRIIYKSHQYEHSIVEQFAEDLLQILISWTDNWSAQLNEILLPSASSVMSLNISEQSDILSYWDSNVSKFPNKQALVFNSQTFTYGQLNEISGRLANHLKKESNIHPDDIVGIYLDESEYCIVSILGILKAGAAFVPLSPKQPREHNRHIVLDTNMTVILTSSEYMFDLDYYQGNLLALDLQLETLEDVEKEMTFNRTPNSLAYVIYTSGTTGKPKGVMVEDRSVVDYAIWLKDSFLINEFDSSIIISSYIFDLGYTSIWGTLLLGGTLHQTGIDIALNPDEFVQEIIDREVTFIKTTPSLFTVLANHTQLKDSNHKLKSIFLGGEYLSSADMVAFKNEFQKVKFINHYGPTEATIGALANVADDYLTTLNPKSAIIGEAKRNTVVQIANHFLEPKSDGFSGEILLGGTGIARGYLNNPELTHKKFIQSTLANNDLLFYRTGDFGRKLNNNKVVFEGRTDRQIKRRGFRIELEGIESILRSNKDVDNCVLWCDRDRANYIIAFVQTSNKVSNSDLNDHILKSLPGYMLPDNYTYLEEMPLLKNGKVDIKSCVAENYYKIRQVVDFVAPEEEVEILIAKTLEEVLEIERVGLNDNFFDLGANSISMIEINTLLNKKFPSVNIVDLFNYPSTAKLAKFILEEQSNEAIILETEFIQVPSTHLRNGSSDSNSEDLRINLDDQLFHDLRKFNSSHNIGYYDVFIALYGYLLSEITNCERVPLFIYIEETNTIRQLQIDFNVFESPLDLIRYIQQSRKNVDADDIEFSLTGSNKVRHKENVDKIIVPFIYKASEISDNFNDRIFNLIVRIDDNDADRLGINLSYDGNLFQSEKMKELLGMYNSLINNTVEL